jgi:hypothetical protein
VREGFELVCGIDGVELIDSTRRSMRSLLRFEGFFVQNRVHGNVVSASAGWATAARNREWDRGRPGASSG